MIIIINICVFISHASIGNTVTYMQRKVHYLYYEHMYVNNKTYIHYVYRDKKKRIVTVRSEYNYFAIRRYQSTANVLI